MSDLHPINQTLTVAQIASRLKSGGEKVVALVAGIPAAGKSTLTGELLAQAQFLHLNADGIRYELTGDECNYESEEAVWVTFQSRFEAALQSGADILIDNMNHTRRTRERLAITARSFGYAVKLILLATPLAECIERNKRRGKKISEFTIMEKFMQFTRYGAPLDDEWALWLVGGEQPGEYIMSPRSQSNVEQKLDIVGDVHGCLSELKKLVAILGYELKANGSLTKPYGRNLAFVGDLVDRGPDSAGVLEYAIKLREQGVVFVLGNHCYKLLRALTKESVKIGKALQVTLDQIHARGEAFTQAVIEFLKAVPTLYETQDLIIVHAAYKELARGESAERLALYGETTGERDKNGFPVRLDQWETAYLGGKTIVHGHVPLREPKLRPVTNGGRIVNVDTSCCFGGKLTALRYPEMEFISVPAGATYHSWAFAEEEADPNNGGAKVLDYLDKNPIWAGAYGLGKGLPTLARFAEMERDGWIWSKSIKSEDGRTFRLFNYGKTTTYERVWNDVTTVARGLIVCEETGECIAAAMSKFFNLGETVGPGKVASVKDGSFQAFVKMDGACGIGYRLNNALRFATRGAFSSPQAQAAEQIWRAKYAQHEHLFLKEWNHLTPIVEIIHPITKQVVKYGFSDLVLIACRDRFTGKELPYDELVAIGARIGMPVVEKIDSDDPEAVLARVATLDGNEEGFVWLWPCGYRVKTKGEKYKLKHKLLAGITPSVLANAWWDGSIGDLIPVLEEEFREETEALVRQLDANTIELVLQVEALYQQGREHQDQKSFAAWVKTQPPKMAGLLFARKQLDYPKTVSNLIRAALAELVAFGRLHKLLEETGADELRLELSRYERSLSQYLWDNSRTQERCGRTKALAQSLPKPLRGAFTQALENLQPQLIVEKVREFVRTSPHAEVNSIDVDAIFAKAPPPTAPEQIHNSWVFLQDMRLRPFLDRWRHCGQRDTANIGARKLLAEAVRTGCVEEALSVAAAALKAQGYEDSDVVFAPEVLAARLNELAASLESIWQTLPRQDGPQAIADAVANLGVQTGYGKALLAQVWSSQRAQVRDLYLESDPEMQTFSRLEEA